MTDQTDIFADAEGYDLDNMPDHNVTEDGNAETVYRMDPSDQAAWKTVNIVYNDDGTLNLSQSCMLIGRYLTRRGHGTPKSVIGKPFENSWWGPEAFTLDEVVNYFMKYDVDVERSEIQSALNGLVRQQRISAKFRRENGEDVRERNTYQANSAML